MTQDKAALIGKEPARRAREHSAVGHRYRPEIDGLRAIAVIPVILFHAGFEHFSGGYVGVDVFFVISGYLITSIIMREREAGKFTLASFYERRARRILPALFLVMALCIPFSLLLMLPNELENFGGSLIATSAFVSNIFFWQTTGYFDGAAELKPLLHTWSLGIEEQYYIFFPLFVALLFRWKRGLLLATFGIAALSLALSIYVTPLKPGASFYLLPTRAWELLAGSLLVMSGATAAARTLPGAAREAVGWLGAAAIAVPIVLYDHTTAFPGWAALAPVAGTAMIIATIDDTGPLGRLLTLRPLLWIGAISYSAYLYHQPVFAFARLYWGELPAQAWLALAALSIAIAHFSWRYVEAPFRKRGNFTRARIFLYTGIGSALFVVAGAALIETKGLPQRYDDAALPLLQPERSEVEGCPDAGGGIFRCDLGRRTDGAPQIVLLGDSHAYAIASELDRQLSEAGISGALIHTQCHPIPAIHSSDVPWSDARQDACARANRAMIEAATAPGVEAVIVAIRWTARLYPMDDREPRAAFDNGEGGVELDFPERRTFAVQDNGELDESPQAKRAALDQYVSQIARAKPVTILYPVPEAGWNPGELNRRTMLREGAIPDSISTSAQRFRDRNGSTIAALDSIKNPQISRVRPGELFCDTVIPDRCAVQFDRTLYYYDDDHVSTLGARLLVERIMATLPVDETP